MARTARSIIKSSLRKIGCLAAGEDLDPNEAIDALEDLNSMLKSSTPAMIAGFEVLVMFSVVAPPALRVPSLLKVMVFTAPLLVL